MATRKARAASALQTIAQLFTVLRRRRHRRFLLLLPALRQQRCDARRTA